MENRRGSGETKISHPRSETSIWENLSRCLVEQILLRLPLDSLARFRVVCRDWNELLRSGEFLKEREIIGHSEWPWILSFFKKSNVGNVYKSSSKLWHQIDICGTQEPSWFQGLLSDGGLICYNSNILNPLTHSIRHLRCPLLSGELALCQLKLLAFKVNRTTNFYQVFLLVKERDMNFLQSYYYLLVYDSKKGSWQKTQRSPMPLDFEQTGVIFNGRIYSTIPEDIEDDMEFRMLHYELSEDKWGSFTISPYCKSCGLQFEPRLHEWQNRLYLISLFKSTYTVSVEEVRIGAADCVTLETMVRSNCEDFLVDKFSDFIIHHFSVCENFIILCIKGGVTFYPARRYFARDIEFPHIVIYDFHTQKWSSVEEQLSIFRPKVMSLGFKPRLDVTP